MMNEIAVLENEFGLEFNGKGVTVSSKFVALKFEKEHTSILKTINGETRKGEHVNGLIDGINNSGGNPLQYFIPSEYKDVSGKINKEYLLTRDGFSLLVMGFTGQKALQWKLKYVDAFNKMEEYIKKQSTSITIKQTENLQKDIMFITSVVNQMATATSQYMILMSEHEKEIKKEVVEIVKDSINVKDEQINDAISLIGIRDKNTKYLTNTLKEKLSSLMNKNINATNPLYIKVKNKIFKEYKVFTWEQIPIGKFNAVYAYIDSLEKEDLDVA